MTFMDVDGETDILFAPTGFATAGARDGHGAGWTEVFAALALARDALNAVDEATQR